ncbi:plasminogen receptor (KT)-like [Mercenaria mercenaria]|uniref:plasminogen receptor (KT)-like n=1 Tax=Mercenaria mercenaria TaxID=6596 RepID=UPI001E1DD8C7|nr:plasminogen receptor (KT)-like [Mercenaria mercenaria]XP_045158866.1 plasminogen receptor (KT)-like [Mercenaria mercenaria]XP_053394666.1 plasminogen receptor (KT)-like [Mercenaria mercenaria]
MGSVVGKVMEENFKKQQEFMEKSQSEMLERQIQMQNQMRERQAAMMIARSRDMFQWWSAFYATLAVMGIAGFVKKKSPAALAPLVPFGFIVGYQYDLAYSTKMQRCRAEAERVMEQEGSYIQLPHNLPTLQSIDAARQKGK